MDWKRIVSQVNILEKDGKELELQAKKVERQIDVLQQQLQDLQREKMAIATNLAIVQAKKDSFAATYSTLAGMAVPTSDTNTSHEVRAPPSQRVNVIDLGSDDSTQSNIDIGASLPITAPEQPPNRRPDIVRLSDTAAHPSQFTLPTEFIGKDEGCIHPNFPTVVLVHGRFVEVICRFCDGNQSNGCGRAGGIHGIRNHVIRAHAPARGEIFYKERVVSPEDVSRMQEGRDPDVAIIARPYRSSKSKVKNGSKGGNF